MSKITYMTDEQIGKLNEKQLGEALTEKRDALALVFKDTEITEIPQEDAVEIKNQNDEIGRIAARYDDVAELTKAKHGLNNLSKFLDRPDTSMWFPEGGGGPQVKSQVDAGQLFVKSEAFKNYAERGDASGSLEMPLSALYPELKDLEFGESGEFEMKGTLGTDTAAAGVDSQYDIQNIRLPGVIGPIGERRLRIENLFPSAGMIGNAIPYMEETTTTDTVVEVEEAATKPEVTLGFTEKSSPAAVIAGFMPMTRQIMSDWPAVRGYVNGRLRYFVDRRTDLQLLNGDGSGANLTGVLNTSGIQTQAKGGDPVPDAVYKAIVKVQSAVTGYFADPDAYVTHPADWQDVRLLRTADGIYIWGSPADVGPNRIWGLRVVVDTSIAENTGLVGSFAVGGMIFNRWGLTVRVADQHSTDFTANKVTVLAERRLALPIFRPAAFCTVTGI